MSGEVVELAGFAEDFREEVFFQEEIISMIMWIRVSEMLRLTGCLEVSFIDWRVSVLSIRSSSLVSSRIGSQRLAEGL